MMIQQLSRSQSKEPRGCEAHGDEAEREEERKTLDTRDSSSGNMRRTERQTTESVSV